MKINHLIKKLTAAALVLMILQFFSCKEDEPDPVTDTEFTLESEITPYATWAAMRLTVTANKIVSRVGFFLAEQSGVDSTNTAWNEMSRFENKHVGHLKGLTPGVTYYARPFAIIENKTHLGDEKSFTAVLPVLNTVSPLAMGPLGEIKVSGTLNGAEKSDVKVFVGGVEAEVINVSDKISIKLSDETRVGREAEIKINFNGYEVVVP